MLKETETEKTQDFIIIFVIGGRSGILEDVLGREDTLWSPWPWPRSLKSSKIALSSAEDSTIFEPLKFRWKTLETLRKICKDLFFWFPQVEIAWKKFWRPFSPEKNFWRWNQGVEPNLNPNRKPEWTVSFWWTRTEPEPAKFYFSEPEPNLNPQNCAQVNPNRTWTPNKSKNIFFHIWMPLALVHAQ